jgi:hypothetical protein
MEEGIRCPSFVISGRELRQALCRDDDPMPLVLVDPSPLVRSDDDGFEKPNACEMGPVFISVSSIVNNRGGGRK